MWRPSFLFPDLEIPAAESRRAVVRVEEEDAPIREFQLTFERDYESDDEWEDDDLLLDEESEEKEEDSEFDDTNSKKDTDSDNNIFHERPKREHRPQSSFPKERVTEENTPVGDFQLELESEDEWDDEESEEFVKFNDDITKKTNDDDDKQQRGSFFWANTELNQSASSFSSGFTLNLDYALEDIRELEDDIGDLKTALKKSLDGVTPSSLPIKSNHSSTTLSSGDTTSMEDSMLDIRDLREDRGEIDEGAKSNKRLQESLVDAPLTHKGLNSELPPELSFPILDISEPSSDTTDDAPVGDSQLECEEVAEDIKVGNNHIDGDKAADPTNKSSRKSSLEGAMYEVRELHGELEDLKTGFRDSLKTLARIRHVHNSKSLKKKQEYLNIECHERK